MNRPSHPTRPFDTVDISGTGKCHTANLESRADTMGRYLDEIASHLLLTADDEVAFSRLIDRGRRARRG